MIPVVTPEEMHGIDRAAPESVDVLIGRAGGAVFRAALALLGGTYGRRVTVIAGKGNNGNDGREAARRLRARGVRVREVAPGQDAALGQCDLVIDAAFGTGFRGVYDAPVVQPGTPVLAVDIPSGVNALTGEAEGRVLPADLTVTFAALKPGLLVPPGSSLAGDVRVADIGLDCSRARCHVVEPIDVRQWVPSRAVDTHKWRSAVWFIGGSVGLQGAAELATRAATRAGAGYVRWSAPGSVPDLLKPVEVVGTAIPSVGWAAQVLEGQERFAALAVGNGLGLDPACVGDVVALVTGATRPIVVDADALSALASAGTPSGLGAHVVLTPHDGEFARLAGTPVGADRIASARSLAARTGAIVLLKGPATIVAHPDGRVLVSTCGDARLATLGSGDVLAGIIAALCAQGANPFQAAAAGAFLHGRAGTVGLRAGLVAGDLIEQLPLALAQLTTDTTVTIPAATPVPNP